MGKFKVKMQFSNTFNYVFMACGIVFPKHFFQTREHLFGAGAIWLPTRIFIVFSESSGNIIMDIEINIL